MTGAEIQRVSSRQDDWAYAKALATAGEQLPRKFQGQPGNVLVAMEYARSLNLPIMVGITGVQVIDGVPSINAQTMQALVRRAGHHIRVGGDGKAGHCEIVRRDDPDYTYRVTYSLEDAQQAGLLTISPTGAVRARHKSGAATPWELHTRAMLRARAISECCRMACADVLAGVAYTPEELSPGLTVDAEPFRIDPDLEAEPASFVPARSGGTYSQRLIADMAGHQDAPEPERPAEAPTEAAETAAEPLPDAAGTQGARHTEAWRQSWQTALDDAAARGDLEAVAALGRDAYAANQGDLGAQARGVWARVQVAISEAGQ